MPVRVFSLLALIVALAIPSAAQPTLTVDLITQDPETWIGAWPSGLFWTEAGDAAYFSWNPRGAMPSDSLYRVQAGGGDAQRVSPAARRALPMRYGGWRATEARVTTQGGDLVLWRDGRQLELTQTRARESSPVLSADEQTVYYVTDGNVFALDLDSGRIRQLTDLRSGSEPSDPKADELETYLRDQQTRLLGVIRNQVRQDSLRQLERERDVAAQNRPETFYLGSKSLRNLTVDPTGRFVTFNLTTSSDAEPTTMSRYVTASGHVEEIRARPKVGGSRPGATFHVQDLARDTTMVVDLTTLPGAFEPADYQPDSMVADSTREYYAWGPSWRHDGRYGVLDVRSRDNKDRWLARLNPEDGTLTVLDHQRDEAWIGGPGISSWGGPSSGGWMPDGRYWFQSERTGWSHLYAVDVASGDVDALTSGAFEISNPQITPDGRHWIFQSSEKTPYESHVYRMPIDGGAREQLTRTPGRWDIELAPDGEHAAYLFSTSNRPPEVYIGRLGREPQRVTTSPTGEWLAYPWREAEMIEIPASDGAQVPARIYRPDNPNGAAVFFVHGAGYLQNAHRWWSSYFREYQFHNLLADQGYLVLDLDYRASAGLGRDWRTAIYRHMGGRDLGDYVDASTWVTQEFGIDPERVAIYGGSYGGFITLMALFTAPESFGSGAALRSVTDWSHYNDGYTRNILNTPLVDPEAFRRSSPIEFAEGLEDPLLMTHGLVDNNVQPQDIFRLSQRLIELGKRDWELAIAPVEPHGYREPTSWADKLHRIHALFERTVGPGASSSDE
ncbi:MAG: prolyl oligopeptidase family serine peptidase [Bacteroidota bacterium]